MREFFCLFCWIVCFVAMFRVASFLDSKELVLWREGKTSERKKGRLYTGK